MYIEAEVVKCAGQDEMIDRYLSHTIIRATQDDLIAMSDVRIGAKRMTWRWCEIVSDNVLFWFCAFKAAGYSRSSGHEVALD